MAEHMESMDDYKTELEASFRQLGEGDIVTATVIAVSEEEATLDLKYYAPGIIRAGELSDDPDYAIMEELHPGDEIQAAILRMDDGEGNILLSCKEASQTLGWEKLKEAMDQETVLTVRVKEAINAGVIAYAQGLRAFIPASQLSLDYVADTSAWVGRDLEVRVITVDPEKKKLVEVARECIDVGLKEVKPWGFLGDMGQAIHDYAYAHGYTVVREIGGHGVGLEFHEDPWVSYNSKRGTEMLMVPGMIFTIEPMINMGRAEIYIDDKDGWTVYTQDGMPSAQWEVQVLVTDDGYEIISY